MDYNKKLNKIMKANKIKSIISFVMVITASIPFFILLNLTPILPPIGDRSVASYFMYVIVKLEINFYFRLALVSIILFIISLISLVVFNILQRKADLKY